LLACGEERVVAFGDRVSNCVKSQIIL